MNRILPWLAAFVLATAPAAVADQASVDRLHAFSDDLRSLTATFVQTVYDEEQMPVQESEGRAFLQRPGLFRWEYLTPYEQIIVADGERLWVYDEDLEQVTVREADQALATAPIMLLSGREPLEDQFHIRGLGQREGLQWVELRPRVGDTEFERIYLGFNHRSLRVMELRDRFDQATQILFDDLVINPTIDPERFRFTPPPGADVIGDNND